MVHYRNSLKSPILRWTTIPSSYTRVKERPFRKKIIALCLNSERSRGGVEWQISLNELASKGRNVYRDVYRKLAPKSFTRIKSNRSNLVERRKLRSSNDQPLLAPGSSRVFHERRARKKSLSGLSLPLSLSLSFRRLYSTASLTSSPSYPLSRTVRGHSRIISQSRCTPCVASGWFTSDELPNRGNYWIRTIPEFNELSPTYDYIVSYRVERNIRRRDSHRSREVQKSQISQTRCLLDRCPPPITITLILREC